MKTVETVKTVKTVETVKIGQYVACDCRFGWLARLGSLVAFPRQSCQTDCSVSSMGTVGSVSSVSSVPQVDQTLHIVFDNVGNRI